MLVWFLPLFLLFLLIGLPVFFGLLAAPGILLWLNDHRLVPTERPLYSSCRPLSTERAGTTLAEIVTRTQVWVGGSRGLASLERNRADEPPTHVLARQRPRTGAH